MGALHLDSRDTVLYSVLNPSSWSRGGTPANRCDCCSFSEVGMEAEPVRGQASRETLPKEDNLGGDTARLIVPVTGKHFCLCLVNIWRPLEME